MEENVFTCRKLNLADYGEVAKVAEIHATAPRNWQPGYILEPEKIKHFITKIRDIAGKPERLYLLAVAPDGEIVGFHWIDLGSENGKTFAHIVSLWTHGNFQRQGIAKDLKRKGEEWAKSKGAVYMKTNVHSNNKRMMDFNLRLGYKPGFVEMIKDL